MKTETIPAISNELQSMLDELQSFRLEVVLVPQRYRTNEGGMVRVAVSQNAKWYRDFCAAHSSGRKRKNAAFDTRIKRAATIRTLSQMVNGEWRSAYAPTLAAIARSRANTAAQVDPWAARRAMTAKLYALA